MSRFLFVGEQNAGMASFWQSFHATPYAGVVLDVWPSLGEVQLLSLQEYQVVFLRDAPNISPSIIALREREPDLPLIVLCADDDHSAKETVLDAGAFDYLLNAEMDAAHLSSAIRHALNQHQSWLALRASEAGRQLVMETSAQGIWRFLLKPPVPIELPEAEQATAILQGAQLVECNDVKAQMYGFAHAQEMEGLWLRDVISENDAATLQFLRKLVHSGYSLREEELLEFDREGQPKYFRHNVAGRVENGCLVEIWGAQSDITQQKQVLDERDRFFEMSLDMMVISDLNGYFSRVNPAWSRVLGYSTAELISQPFIEFVHPDDSAATREEMARIYRGEKTRKFENRYRCRDGSYKLLEWNTISNQSAGLIYSVATDITDRKRAELEILNSRNRLSSIVNSALDAIITLDEAMSIVLFNPAAEKMFGASSAQMLGQLVTHLIPNRFHALYVDRIASFRSAKTPDLRLSSVVNVKGLRSDGEIFPIEASISQVQLDGQKLLTVILRDVTERTQAENKLRASQERLQVALQGGQIGLWEWTAANDATYFSPQYKKQLGYEEDEFADSMRSYVERLHPEDRTAILKRNVELRQGGASSYQHEFRLRHKNGTYRWILSQGTIFRDETGQATRILGTHIDITERKLVEAELIRSREALQQAHDALEQRVETRTSELARTNKTLQAEVKEHQVTMGALREAVTQVEQARDETERANTELRANEMRLLHGNRIFTELTKLRVSMPQELESVLHAITEAGSDVLALERCSVWLYQEENHAIQCLDLYERSLKRHSLGEEFDMREYPHYFRALQAQEYIVADSAQTDIRAGEFSDSYLIPNHIASMLDAPIIIGGKMVGVLCCEQVGEPRHWKVEDQTFAGSLASVCALMLESLERARAEAALIQAKNEAEIAREEAVLANQAKSEFLSRMSHELRTPMNSILGFAQILEMSVTDEKQAQRVGYILKAGRHLLQLINEVLDVARVESGHLSMSPEPVMVADILQSAVGLIQPLCQEKSLHVEIEWGGCENFFVQADQQHLSQVLLNLLSNAVKYNREHGEIRVKCEATPKGRIRISVIDTGQGIAPAHLPKLFHPFERLGLETGAIEGTGLGLALSKRIVEMMGGTIGVESTFGTGSTFWIDLPTIDGPPPESIASSGNALTLSPSGQAHTILYIEDNLTNLQVLKHLLAREPNVVLLSATHGQVGLELARQHHPALILLDLHLPDISGEEVLRRLRSEPDLSQIPVVIVSADATSHQIKRLLAAGAAEYLTKPLDLKLFLATMRKFLPES